MSLNFSLEDIFPLFPLGKYTYAEEKQHAEKVDEYLGFNFEKSESLIRQNPDLRSTFQREFWAQLPVQAMQTPYTEIRALLEILKPADGETVCDLGCAYGRMGFVLDRHFPGTKFIGFEAVKQRVDEAGRVMAAHSLKNSKVICQDLAAENFKLPEAEFYFLFDFGSEADIESVMSQLKEIALRRKITVVGRGKRSRYLIHRNHPWLFAVVEPQHFDHFSIYRSR